MPSIPQYVAQKVPQGFVASPGGAPVVDLSGLTNLANQMEREQRQIATAQEHARASEVLADAQLQWTQREQESQTAYDPAKGADYTPAVLQSFDEYRGRVVSKAGSKGEEQYLLLHMNQMRADVGTRALQFEAKTRMAYRRQTLGDTLDKRVAAAELDPSQALDLMAQQLVNVDASDQLSPLERNEFREQAKGAIALAAARTLAASNPAALREHPVFSMIPAAHLPEILKAARHSEVLTRAQQVADDVMSRGLPLDQAMRSVEKDFQGEDERAVKTEVLNRYSYADAARKDQEQEIYGTAQLEVEQRGRVTPQTWSKLTDTHRAAILNRQQAEARQRRLEAAGTPVKTDFSLYLDLRQQAIDSPADFARVDLKQYVDRIGGAQLEQLVDLKTKVASPKTQRDHVTLTQQMNATMTALGIKKPEAKGKFQSYVQAAVDDATQANGKPLSFDQRQSIIDRAVLQGPDPSAWFFGEKRTFELTPDERTRFKPNAATDAPATEIEALNEALQAQGIAATPANRLSLYTRSMSKAQ